MSEVIVLPEEKKKESVVIVILFECHVLYERATEYIQNNAY